MPKFPCIFFFPPWILKLRTLPSLVDFVFMVFSIFSYLVLGAHCLTWSIEFFLSLSFSIPPKSPLLLLYNFYL